MLNKIKKFKFIMIAEIVALFLLILFISPRKAFSELIPGNYTVGDERHKVTMSRSIRNYDSTFGRFYDLDYMSRLYVNYVDENGNSFDFSKLTEDIEYDCNGNTCSIEYNKNSETMFNEKLGFILVEHGNGSNLVSDVYIPKTFTYESTNYSLDYYYATYGCDYSYYYSRIYNIRLDDEIIGYNKYWVNPMTEYYSEKIEVDETDDNLFFYWEYFTNKIIFNLNDITDDNIYEEMGINIYTYINDTDDYARLEHRSFDSKSLTFYVPGNHMFQGRFSFNAGKYMVHLENSENIIYENIPYYSCFENYKYFDFYPSSSEESSITMVSEELPAPIVISNNTLRDVGGDGVFGYTITLDEKLNGTYLGNDYIDGVTRVYVYAEDYIKVYLPKNNMGYTVVPDQVDGLVVNKSEFSGHVSLDNDSYVDTEYRQSPENSVYYYGTVVGLEDLVPGKSYVIFRSTGGVGYMLTGKGNAKEISRYSTNVGDKVLWPNSGEAYSNVLWTYSGTPDKALFESFGAVNTYLTVGKSTSGKRPVGNEVSYVKLVTSSSPAMKVSNGGYYLALNSTKDKYSSSTSGSSLYFAEIDEDIHKVKFYGTNEGLHIYEGAVDKEYSVISGAEIVAPGTDSIKSPEKYNYVLDSWIDLSSKEVVKPGDTIEIDKDRVFYANWVPKTYDIGVNTDTVSTVDTNDFIKTEIFDYNELFNLHSSTYNNNRWSLASKGNTSHTGTSLGLVFFDNAKNSKAGLLNSVDGRDKSNGSRQVENGPSYYDGIVTQGIGNDIISHLFDKAETDLGVNYVGEGNHLYQYDEKTGFYYYDSRKNAASYNASKQRFYVYNYKYGTSKSMAEGENGADFLPFNYMKKSDALNGKSVSSSNGATNYWFGLKSEIDFYLTDDVGRVDSDGEYGNKALNGNDMILKFSGDDDVWIFVDDKLVLDLGGSHDIVYGEINFSTGVVTVAHNGAIINTDAVGGIGFSQNEVADNTKIIQTKLSGIKAGEHKATFYYVERGASRSNVSLYFNINDKLDEPGTIVVTRDEESYESFEKHEFTLKLNNTTINGQYGELMFKDGEAKFKLLGGESIKAIGLPAGIKYTLKVFAPVKHTTEFNGVVYESREINGRVVGGNTSEVQYKNLYDEYSEDNNDVIIPDTKDNIFNYLVILITSIFTCVVAVVIYFRINKKQNVVEEIEILSEY